MFFHLVGAFLFVGGLIVAGVGFEAVILLAIVVLMVFKPGSGGG